MMIVNCGILATGQNNKQANLQRIVIQSADNKISESAMDLAADIVTNRLKSFGMEEFEVKTIPHKKEIELRLPDDKNLEFATKLATNKGVLEFYETCNWEEISLMLDAVKLTSLLGSKTPEKSSAELGCTPSANVSRVNAYLKTTSLDKKCKFLWNDLLGDSNVCLYAIKNDNGKGVLLKGSDIESINIAKDASGKPGYIDLRFKQPVYARWAEITKQNIGRSIAIVLDDKVLIAPVLKSGITGGNCQISGKFSEAELRYIVAMGSYSELPAEFKPVK